MAARPSWEGHLRLSLVTCPVALYAATTEAETVRFNLINPLTNNRIKMKTVDAGTGEEVARGDLVKGFEIAKNQYVLLDKEDFEAVKIESTRVIDIEEFVPGSEIDRRYWDTPYHLVPSGKTGIEAFAVIRAAMRKQGKVALGRLVLSTRERVCALEVQEEGLILTTLRLAGEVRDHGEIGHPELPKPDPRMLEIAEKIIEQQTGKFDPSHFTDRYEIALRQLIEQKKKGTPVVATAANDVDDSTVVDLMAALKRSLAGDDSSKRVRAERFTTAARAKSKKSSGKRAA
ncbi:MAG: Ku protein [Vicinamibacterales bacterium]